MSENARETKFSMDKVEMYYYDENSDTYKPIGSELIKILLEIKEVIESKNSRVGYSYDEKPINANNGETFLELDTKKMLVYDGSKWVELIV